MESFTLATRPRGGKGAMKRVGLWQELRFLPMNISCLDG